VDSEDYDRRGFSVTIFRSPCAQIHTAAASAEARAKVTKYVATLFEAGEKDTHRLTVCGLTYLREFDGSRDPVKAGYTGL